MKIKLYFHAQCFGRENKELLIFTTVFWGEKVKKNLFSGLLGGERK